MASQNRNERQLMRQRGAANRTVDNIDFGLSFRTPGSRRSRSGTPVTRASSVSRSSHAGARRSREPSQPQGRRSVSIASAIGEPEDVNPAKRRKITTDSGSSRGEDKTGTIPRRQVSSVFPIAEDEHEGQQPLGLSDGVHVAPEQMALLPLFVSQGEVEEENDIPAEANTTKKKRKRKSVIPASLRRKKRASGGSTNLDLPESVARRSSVLSELGQDEQLQDPQQQEAPVFEDQELLPEVAADSIEYHKVPAGVDDDLLPKNLKGVKNVSNTTKPPKRRKKRHSVNLPPKMRTSSGPSKLVLAGSSKPRTLSPSLIPLTRPSDSEHASDSEDSAPFRPVRHRSQRPALQSLGTSPYIHSRNMDEDSDEEYIDEDHPPEPPTPAPPKKRRQGKQPARSQLTQDQSEPSRKYKKESFPIVTHRMTNTALLLTVYEDSLDPALDEDSSILPATFTDRPTPNSIDVLAQICREVVDIAISRLSAQPEPGISAADRKHKRAALEAFGDDLDRRLFEMSEAVENKIALEARLRKVRREKAELQAQWIEIRKQRERVALKCDRVRAYHWENEREREEKWEVSEAAHEVELEIDRGEVPEEEGLEFLLRSVAREVSGKAPQGGLLARVKSFNGMLERTAAMLEGR